MAQALKHQYGLEVAIDIATQISAVWPSFQQKQFLQEVEQGYESLDLMARAWQMTEGLVKYLPADYLQAIDILMQSLDEPLADTHSFAMSAFRYLPHVFYVKKYGLEHFEASMQAQYVLTQRFTAEFSIRAFIERYPEQTLARLALWAQDPNEHVRRLVSEGTRPRLPWANRLKVFQQDPKPVLSLLELLKDDPSLYVRRSVANNLNDIGKDNPEVLFAVAKRWLQDAPPHRVWLVKHALRFAIKQGDPAALSVLGFGQKIQVEIDKVHISPSRVSMGEKVLIQARIKNQAIEYQDFLVDLCVYYVKANGKSNPKVFKLKTLALEAGQSVELQKHIALTTMTTRRHYAGKHRVSLLINGVEHELGSFTLI